jgi:hypothetical protein
MLQIRALANILFGPCLRPPKHNLYPVGSAPRFAGIGCVPQSS